MNVRERRWKTTVMDYDEGYFVQRQHDGQFR